MPFNEPTFGTRRKSQIQTYLENNNGAGVQHIALKTDNIFRTMREMRQRSLCGGFDFMPAPGQDYYDRVPGRIGESTLTADEFKELQALGLLADKDDQGVLLQVSSPITHGRVCSHNSTRRVWTIGIYSPSWRSTHYLHRNHPKNWLRSK
jgi:4-hydroxyphenylpyruvate dioxygenase